MLEFKLHISCTRSVNSWSMQRHWIGTNSWNFDK